MTKTVLVELPIGLGKSQPDPKPGILQVRDNMNSGRIYPIHMIAEAASMINLVQEAKATNYWSDNQKMSNQKKQKARDKKRWKKIHRKQGRQ
jgi:hypothetical protein